MEINHDTKISNLARRAFLKSTNLIGLGAAAVTLIGAKRLSAATPGAGAAGVVPPDTPTEIFTAALIAEDLATIFYYNGLIGPVIQNPNLAGPGGTATNPNPTNSNPGNVNYLQAALYQEIQHANLLRSLLGIGLPSGDPYQTFYIPSGTFDTLSAFITLLETLEDAFIGAYTIAAFEFAQLAVAREYEWAVENKPGKYTPDDFEYYAEVAGTILGVEAEHRVLGRVIASVNPANNRNYESTDGLRTVYNGQYSAVAALTPFLTSTTGPAYALADALSGAPSVYLVTSGGPPPQM
jgi:hypothetical protein